ncbi:hypothetical protein [Actinopolymorpha alba]|uniref:hypothetical protein n=1 Tax=Actinopolymorpha alba TaxID=533267 RepID=UPI00037B7BE0|nr:hypothetical protein [Actinopolymorpha alba]
MSKQFDPEKIRAAAKELLKTSDRLDQQIDDFLNETRGIGEPCGDAEPIGMLLGISYEAAEEVVIEGLESVVTGFEMYAGKLEAMAVRDELAEQSNQERISTVGV